MQRAKLEQILSGGARAVLTETEQLSPYSLTTLPAATRPGGVVKPRTTEEVQALVRLAREENTPLYPISSGKNWGYGSALAPGDGYWIVDLGEMNRIHEVNEELTYVVIEPGVTQGQLEAYLAEHHPKLWMDANGAGPDTTLVGNLLERGFGHTVLGERAHQFSGLEAVLGTGELLKTGFSHYPNAAAAHTYRYGVGPDLSGLFFQSNYGIVTRVGLYLMPRPQSHSAFLVSASDEQLPHLVNALGRLRRQGTVRSTVHVANALRALTNTVDYPWTETGGRRPVSQKTINAWREEYRVNEWSGTGAIYGTPEQVRAGLDAVRKEMAPLKILTMNATKVRWFQRFVDLLPKEWEVGRRYRNAARMLAPAMGLLEGKQTDVYLRTAGWRSPTLTPDQSSPFANGSGLIWIVPVLPSTGDHARRVQQIVTEIYHRHGFDAPITLTFVNERSCIATTNINYNREDPNDVAAAKACYEEMHHRLIDAGYPPYRSGIGGYHLLDDRSTFWETCRQLKATLDPDGIISPGRYFDRRGHQ